MGRTKRSRLRLYLTSIIKLSEAQQEKFIELNDKVLEMKIERTLLIDAYNYLLTVATKKVEQESSKDEANIWLEERGFVQIQRSKEESILIELMQEYLEDAIEESEEDEELAEVN